MLKTQKSLGSACGFEKTVKILSL